MEGVGTVYICQSGANHVGCGANSVINNGQPLPDIGGSGGGNSPSVIVDLSGAYRPPQIDKNVNSNAYGMKVYAQHVRGLDNFARRGDWGQFNSAANKIFPTDGHKVVGVMDMILNGMHGAAHGLTKLLSPFGKVLASDALMYEKPNFPGQHHGTIDNIVENIINSYPDDGSRIGAILESVPHGFLKTAERLIDNLQTTHSRVHTMQLLNDNGSPWMADHIAARLPNDIARVDGVVEAVKAGYIDMGHKLFNRISSHTQKLHAMAYMDQQGHTWLVNSFSQSFGDDNNKLAGIIDGVPMGYSTVARSLFNHMTSHTHKLHAMAYMDKPENAWLVNDFAKNFGDDNNKLAGIVDGLPMGYSNVATALLNHVSNPDLKVSLLQNAASQGKTNVAQFLIDNGKVDINGRMNGQANPEGTPLYKAIQANQPEMAKWLAAKGGMLVDPIKGFSEATWDYAANFFKSAGEAIFSAPDNFKIVTSALEKEITFARENPEKAWDRTSRGLDKIFHELTKYADTNKLAQELSDYLSNIDLTTRDGAYRATYTSWETLSLIGVLPGAGIGHVSRVRALDRAVSYEKSIKAMYIDFPQDARKFQISINGQARDFSADAVALSQGKLTAVDAKYVENWKNSIRNPASSIGTKPFAVEEQKRMVEQAKRYIENFPGGVTYHTNSRELAEHYTKVFEQQGLKNFRFEISDK